MVFAGGHALLIGVGSYPHSAMMDAHAAVTARDAEALAEIMRDEQLCGYPASQVTVLTHAMATREGVLGALDRLAAATRPDSTVLFFYCGHGEYGEDGAYYLTTHDSRKRGARLAPRTGVREDELLVRLRAIPARRMLLIFNACHAGEIAPTLGEAEAGPQVLGAPLEEATATRILGSGSGRAVIAACRENQVSYIGPGSLTLFTQALADGLRGRGTSAREGFIGLFDLYTSLYYRLQDAVERNVPERLRQRFGAQEPELSLVKGVGPFAVALYRGATALGSFPEAGEPPQGTAVRSVGEAASQAAFGAAVHIGDSVAADRGGVALKVEQGGAASVDTRRVLDLSGSQTGDITIGDVAGRDIVDIDARGSMGAIFGATGPISQRFERRDATGGPAGPPGGVTSVNAQSSLARAGQMIAALHHVGGAEREALKALVALLEAELQRAQPALAGDAEAAAEYVAELVSEAAGHRPRRVRLEVSAEGLRRAAANLAAELPAVPPIAQQISARILALAR